MEIAPEMAARYRNLALSMLNVHKLYYLLGFPCKWVLDELAVPLLKLGRKINKMASRQNNGDPETLFQNSFLQALFVIGLNTMQVLLDPTPNFGRQRQSELVQALLAAKIPEVRVGFDFLG